MAERFETLAEGHGPDEAHWGLRARRHRRRLPHTRVGETVFLTPEEFKLLRNHIERERRKNLAT